MCVHINCCPSWSASLWVELLDSVVVRSVVWHTDIWAKLQFRGLYILVFFSVYFWIVLSPGGRKNPRASMYSWHLALWSSFCLHTWSQRVRESICGDKLTRIITVYCQMPGLEGNWQAQEYTGKMISTKEHVWPTHLMQYELFNLVLHT
jgi:hypothetical protein